MLCDRFAEDGSWLPPDENPHLCSFIGGIIGALGGVASGIIGAGASEEAGKQAAGYYKTAAGYLAPYNTGGQNALAAYQNALGLGPGGTPGTFNVAGFQGSPGYQWQLGQGLDAINRTAAARGGVNSGNTLAQLQQYGQGLANQDWGNYLNRLFGLTGLGERAATSQGEFYAGAGNALAGGTLGAANAITGGLNTVAGNLQQITDPTNQYGINYQQPQQPFYGYP